MNKTDMKIGDVVSLNGSKAALVVESLGQLPALQTSDKVQVVWLDLDCRIQRDVLDCSLLSCWTPPPEKPDHFPAVMSVLSEAMTRIGVPSEPDALRAPAPEESVKRTASVPQRPWTSDVPSDNS